MKLLDNFFITKTIAETENGFEAILQCNPAHIIYQGHFPGNPITPGACIIQVADELMARIMDHKLLMRTIKNVKFLSAIVPKEGKLIRYTFSGLSQTETECKVQVTVFESQTVCAKMSLSFSHDPL